MYTKKILSQMKALMVLIGFFSFNHLFYFGLSFNSTPNNLYIFIIIFNYFIKNKETLFFTKQKNITKKYENLFKLL